MSKSGFLLLKTLLLSTSKVNRVKHSKDPKVRRKAIGGVVGETVGFIVIMVYCILASVGYGRVGQAAAIPGIMASTLTMLALIFTFLKVNGYLFGFKEYDMLMSLPFKPRTVAGAKFLYMYISSLLWYSSLIIAFLIGYAYYERPGVAVYVVWIILGMILPIIPMLIAALLGLLIAKLSAGFKVKNIIQTVLTFVFVLIAFSAQYIIQAIAESGKGEEALLGISDSIENVGRLYLPINWFVGSVINLRVSDMLLLAGISILLFEIIFSIFGRYYRQINSSLKAHAARKDYRVTEQKKRSVINSIAFKELKRMLGSNTYMINACMGLVLVTVLSIACLVVGFDKIAGIVLKGAPITKEMLYPAIPIFMFLFVGMVSTSTMTPSLEGKNYWIVKSLPIRNTDLYKGKMAFNMYLMEPFAVISTILVSCSARIPVGLTILFVIQVFVMVAYSTSFGMVCGIKFIKLQWENEIEVVKQGAAVAIYLFPNMVVSSLLLVVSVYAGMKLGVAAVSVGLTVIYLILAIVFYMLAMKMAKKRQ